MDVRRTPSLNLCTRWLNVQLDAPANLTDRDRRNGGTTFILLLLLSLLWAAIAQSVWRLATSWTVRGSNSVGGEIFRSRPDRSWGLVYNGYRVSFPGVKRPERGVDHPPWSSAEVKKRVELYLYAPSGPSWPVIGWTLPLLLLLLLLLRGGQKSLLLWKFPGSARSSFW
jgi:hypothetical protein